MADQQVVPCPKCGKAAMHKTSMTSNGQSSTTCPHCHRSFFLVVKNGKIVSVN